MSASSWYDSQAKKVSAIYDAISPVELHMWFADLLPTGNALVLDVGAGSGRDAAWLAQRGFEVVAVEPSAGMRAEAIRNHPSHAVQWVDDFLPDFKKVGGLGLHFDFILLSAVWMHVPAGDRARAFRKLIGLLKPGGFIAISLRMGPSEPERGMHPVSVEEIETLCKSHAAFVERRIDSPDLSGRSQVSWCQLVVRLPDDGTGALPLIRHVVLNDSKSSTYKLALLRVLCRCADGTSGFADRDDDCVVIPFGLVGLFWVRMMIPLLKAELPQSPENLGLKRLGFVREGFEYLVSNTKGFSHNDLRCGMRYSGDRAVAIHKAIRDACATVEKMPAHYMTYPNGGQIVRVNRLPPGRVPSEVVLDFPYLSSFGQMRIPANLWAAMQRFDSWIEPAIVSEWSRLMKSYAAAQDRKLSESAIQAALTWADPTRDVKIARLRAIVLLEKSHLRCVWSDRKLTSDNLHIDHCLPWVVWPCGDLWNLLPVHCEVNLRKRDRLPGDELLSQVQPKVLDWWSQAYLDSSTPLLAEQFVSEAKASLPSVGTQPPDPDSVFRGLKLQRWRLKHDQQVPEWYG